MEIDRAALNKQAIASAKHYMGKMAWPTIALTVSVVTAFIYVWHYLLAARFRHGWLLSHVRH